MVEELLKKTFTIFSRNFDKAGENSTEIKALLKSLNFEPDIIRRLVVVAFEAEMNVVMYADGGQMDFVITDEDIRIDIRDQGPGIPDIQQAMQEGYSTATDEMREMGFGFGMGLPNIKKNSDFLNIESRVGKGTTVSAGIRLNANA
ncbi:MAG: anti-sigma regulatory factor [Desulfobacteraceae bacterium]|nr:MAG: anti-sigma regulatory factor [Desulfobacteraceae bacterium]